MHKLIGFTEASGRGRLALFIEALAGVVDAIVYVVTLTLITTHLRATVIFSDWFLED